jgi:LmbE family N-acetylglucosaminyl deacetylase
MKTLELAGSGPLQLLCLGAHPDDIEIGCGGSLLRLLDERPGSELRWVVFTAKGARAAEARRGAERFTAEAAGVEIILHEFEDAFLSGAHAEVKRCFEELKGGPEPDLVFTHWEGDAHQDHRLLSELAGNTFRDHLVLEYEIPKYDGDLGRPNLYLPLSAAQLERKIEGLMEVYSTQRSKDWFDPEVFRGLARLRGMECRAPERYAEAFHLRKAVLTA